MVYRHYGCQHVAFVTNSFDQLRRLGIVVQLLPQAADLQINRALKRLGIAALRQIKNLVAIEYALRMFQQRFEQAEFTA